MKNEEPVYTREATERMIKSLKVPMLRRLVIDDTVNLGHTPP